MSQFKFGAPDISLSVSNCVTSARLLFDTVVTYVWSPCRSVSTGRLSEQPIRITLGGQAYQGSTDSLNTERPMDTGTYSVKNSLSVLGVDNPVHYSA